MGLNFSKKNNKKRPKHPVFRHKRTLGQKLADRLATVAGSWGFILGFLVFLTVWMIINILWATNAWDPYPFILLNLVLSCLAAIQAPVILMSQNRQAQRDRMTARYDYEVNRRAERRIQEVQKELRAIKRILEKQNKH